MLRRAGVIGDPVTHSLSPAIHRAGYAAHGLDWDYAAHPVTAAELPGFVAGCAADQAWVGLSVTAPHKRAIVAFGAADEATTLVGGGNTLLFGERPRVHNTDVPGFVRAWRARGLPAPRTATILGNGATARSIAVALAGLGVRELSVLARDPRRAAGLLELATTLGLDAAAQPLSEPCPAVDLLASTIPAEATAPVSAALTQAAGAIFDVVYEPWPTPLGKAAADANKPALDGLDLLAGQAVDQFFLMTGRRVTFEQCRSAAERELSRRRAL